MPRARLLFVLAALLGGAAAGAMQVKTSHSPTTDFGVYESYDWVGDPTLGPDHPLAVDSELDRKIREAGDEVLAKAGLRRVEEGPDLLIRVVGFVSDHLSVEGERRELGGGVAWIGDPQGHRTMSYQEGTLVFEILDSGTKEIVWSGWATDAAQDVVRLQKKAVPGTRKILRAFPPRRRADR
ncbi:MAG: DUF4136 domain-containing protein [Thermoanaerobaculia bacterium]|nr:DUF4136 domain-containing protein [Thermoanaerobaculia bacterium]